MDRAVLLLCALLLNAVLAGPKSLYAPLRLSRISRYPATLLYEAERKLNREQRSVSQRAWRGAILTVAVLLASGITGVICAKLFKYNTNLRFLEMALMAVLLPVRPTWDSVAQIFRGLKRGDITKARLALEGTVWRHNMLLDEYGLARAGIEMLAVHFSEKILAPALWYLVLGLPGFFISKSIYLMAENLPSASIKHLDEPGFGEATRTVYYYLHYIPVRIAAALWVVAVMFLPSGQPRSVVEQMMDGEIKKGFPQTVSALAAASALNLSLGGVTSAYTGAEWIGTGTIHPTPAAVRRGLYLFVLLHLLLFILIWFFL